MEYYRDKDGQIQADIAYRLGRIILQYESLNIKATDKFESTLYLAVLQNILTNCIELLNALSRRERKANLVVKSAVSEMNIFNLSLNQVKYNSFNETLTCEKIIRHIRNAMSHPTKISIDSEFCSTGYTTIVSEKNIISEYCFVSSPDTRANRPKLYNQSEMERVNNLLSSSGNFPPDIKLVSSQPDHYFMKSDGKPFARVIKIVLTTAELRALTLGLCIYLAQPIQENWDGATIKFDLIAA